MDQNRPQHRWKSKNLLWYLYLFPDLALPSIINSYFMSHCPLSTWPVFYFFSTRFVLCAGSCSVASNSSFRCKHFSTLSVLDSRDHVLHLILLSDTYEVVGLPVQATFVSCLVWKLRSASTTGSIATDWVPRAVMFWCWCTVLGCCSKVVGCCYRVPQCCCRALLFSIKQQRTKTACPHLWLWTVLPPLCL